MGQAKDLIGEIQRGKISPVYLLHGEETYLIEDTLAEMIEILAPKNVRDFNLDVFSDSNVSVNEILSMADTYPVMAERRVVVVKDPAFLGSAGAARTLVDIFRESRELYRAGSAARSAALLARALDLDPEEFAESRIAFTRAAEAFKRDNEEELSSDDLEFLEDAADTLTAEIEFIPASSSVSDVDRLLEWLRERPAPTTVLIFAVTSALDGRGKVVKAISDAGKVVNFGRLRRAYYVNRDPMYRMVTDKLREHKKTIAPDAFSELQKKTGNGDYINMRQIFDELDKLVTFVGERQRIEKSDVAELVARTGSDRIFDLTNAIGQRSLPLALANLKSIVEKGDHPLLIHNMLTRQIRFLLQAKLLLERGDLKPDVSRMSYDAFQQRVYKKLPSELIDELPESKSLNLLKQHPYPLHLTLRQAKNFTVQELIKAMERLLEADIQLKTGRLTPKLVVEMLVMELVGL
jgi:DNA polymerase-3 subunit delta